MSLSQAKKAVVSLVFAGAAAAAFIVQFDPNLTESLVALTGAVFAVIGVFVSKNHTEDDLSKAVSQLQGSALSVVGFFTVVPTTTVEKVTALVASLLSVYGVYKVTNEPE